MALTGDESLFDDLVELTHEEYFWPDLQAAYCWDFYGLPDGTKNPKGRGYSVHFQEGTEGTAKITVTLAAPGREVRDARDHDLSHVLMAPPDDYIDWSFNRVLKDVLKREDLWLLSIPRRYANLGVLEARIICSETGGTALVMPRGTLSGLFLANELIYQLRDVTGSGFANRHGPLPQEALAKVLTHWLLRPTGEPWVSKLETELSGCRRMYSDENRRLIWATTVAQQLFLILHEFGHLLALNALSGEAAPNTTGEEEIRADAFAIQCTTLLAKRLFGGDLGALRESTLLLFAMMEYLRRAGCVRLGPSVWFGRFWQVTRSWAEVWGGAVTREHAQTLLDGVELFFKVS